MLLQTSSLNGSNIKLTNYKAFARTATLPTQDYTNPVSPQPYHIPWSIFQRRSRPGHSRRRIRRGLEDEGEQDQEAGGPRPERAGGTDRVRLQYCTALHCTVLYTALH